MEQDFEQRLYKVFPHEPTEGQKALIKKLSVFLFSPMDRKTYVIRGYAGTGKTTLVSTLVKNLHSFNLKTVLLAPTGRAAKVLSNYSKKQAFTIHKKIYKRAEGKGGESRFILQKNLHTNTVFFVDEASMISNSGSLSGGMFSDGSLLEDLIEYTFEGKSCMLIFIGDTAQLPPVGCSVSPALDVNFLKTFDLNLGQMELKEVVRQDEDSGILYNATLLRLMLAQGNETYPSFDLANYPDIFKIKGDELEDALNQAYDEYGIEETVIICRSNKRANLFNQQVRARIRYQEEELAAGDYMMVVKNNYFWLPEESKAGFIANGDTIELLKIGNIEEQYGFRFADVRMRMVDYPDEPELEVKVILDTILAETPSLTSQQNKQLYESVLADYMDIGDKRKRKRKMKEDVYFNALQVKYSYAVTCHKSQGGQWSAVFVDQGYLTNEMLDTEYLRWLYTALTRATKKLYLVNFDEQFFSE